LSSVLEQPQTTKKRDGRQPGRAPRQKVPRAASYTTGWGTTSFHACRPVFVLIGKSCYDVQVSDYDVQIVDYE